jgi:hypothetical protein
MKCLAKMPVETSSGVARNLLITSPLSCARVSFLSEAALVTEKAQLFFCTVYCSSSAAVLFAGPGEGYISQQQHHPGGQLV